MSEIWEWFVGWLLISAIIVIGIGGIMAIDWLLRVVSITVVVRP